MKLRRGPGVPGRGPHPDARVEVQFAADHLLRRSAGRIKALLDGYRVGIARVSAAITRNSGSSFTDGRRRDVGEMTGEVARLNRENAELHEQIRELCSKLSDDDLLWLDPRPLPQAARKPMSRRLRRGGPELGM